MSESKPKLSVAYCAAALHEKADSRNTVANIYNRNLFIIVAQQKYTKFARNSRIE
jgi:hypothetical protein